MVHYFAVETKCGHVGKERCVYIWFAVKAENKKAAAARAREYKRVKHHHKNAIRNVREISYEEYVQLRIDNENDPYLKCINVQQQRCIENFEVRIEPDEYALSKRKQQVRSRDTAYLLKKNAIQKKDAIRRMREDYYRDEIAV